MKSFYILLIAFSCYIPVSTGQSHTEPAQLGYVNLETFLELVMPVFEKRELETSKTNSLECQDKFLQICAERNAKYRATQRVYWALANLFISRNKIRTCVIRDDDEYELHMRWALYGKFADPQTSPFTVLLDRLLIVSLQAPDHSIIEFPLGLSKFPEHTLSSIICSICDHEYICLFNIFDLIESGAFYLTHQDVINFYQEYFGYNPQPYIDEYNNQKYQEWLKWRNRDYVAIYPEMSTATLYQHDAHIEQPEMYAPWFPESITTTAPTKPTP